MITPAGSPSIESRLTAMERQLLLWRRLALALVGLVALTGALGFRHLAPGPLEGTSLTLHNASGGTVALSLRPEGELEVQFRQGKVRFMPGAERTVMPAPASSAVVIVSPQGREVVRLGEPMARPLAP